MGFLILNKPLAWVCPEEMNAHASVVLGEEGATLLEWHATYHAIV
jgi:hypothetical protein